MTQFTVHSYRRCPFAIRVRMTLEEKNLEFKTIEEKLSALSPELLRAHPEGKVPLLLHEGTAIHESSIITEYLEDLFPNPSLRPLDALGKAKIRMWTYWCDRIFKPDLDLFKYQWPKLSPDQRVELQNRISSHLAKMSLPLTKAPYLLGRDFTLADIHVFPFYRQIKKAHPEFSTLFPLIDDLNQWLDRITSRPSFERTMAKRI